MTATISKLVCSWHKTQSLVKKSFLKQARLLLTIMILESVKALIHFLTFNIGHRHFILKVLNIDFDVKFSTLMYPQSTIHRNFTSNTHLAYNISLEFNFDVSVDSIQQLTDTSKSNSTFCTFSDKCSGPEKIPSNLMII